MNNWSALLCVAFPLIMLLLMRQLEDEWEDEWEDGHIDAAEIRKSERKFSGD